MKPSTNSLFSCVVRKRDGVHLPDSGEQYFYQKKRIL